MFEKSKSEITFKDLKNKLNIATDFENDWGHFCDLDDNNYTNNNIVFYNNLYQPIKKRIKKEKKVEEKKVEEKNDEEKNYDTKKYIIDTIFSCISVAFITFVSFNINYFTCII